MVKLSFSEQRAHLSAVLPGAAGRRWLLGEVLLRGHRRQQRQRLRRPVLPRVLVSTAHVDGTDSSWTPEQLLSATWQRVCSPQISMLILLTSSSSRLWSYQRSSQSQVLRLAPQCLQGKQPVLCTTSAASDLQERLQHGAEARPQAGKLLCTSYKSPPVSRKSSNRGPRAAECGALSMAGQQWAT